MFNRARRWRRPHGPAELTNVVAACGLVVVACQRMSWIGLPDLQIVAARRSLDIGVDPPGHGEQAFPE
jgi:hypothetical protein